MPRLKGTAIIESRDRGVPVSRRIGSKNLIILITNFNKILINFNKKYHSKIKNYLIILLRQ